MRWNLIRGLLVFLALAITATACVIRTRPHGYRTVVVEKHKGHEHEKHKKHKKHHDH